MIHFFDRIFFSLFTVSGISKKQLDEIRALARPPAAIRLTMEAVTMMLNPER